MNRSGICYRCGRSWCLCRNTVRRGFWIRECRREMSSELWSESVSVCSVSSRVWEDNRLLCRFRWRSFIMSVNTFDNCTVYRLMTSMTSQLEGKTSIELLHKRVSFSSVFQPQIFRSSLKIMKQRYFWKKCTFWPFAIHIKPPRQYLNHKQCDKTL